MKPRLFRRRPPTAPALREGYWRDTALDAMSEAEWEALCDGCGRCCLLKLEDDAPDGDGVEIFETDVACRLLDPDTCRCGSYALRKRLVPQCVVLTPQTVRDSAPWMPETCAYRRLAEGRELPDWHPLVTGDPASTHKAGVSVRGETVPEYEVDEEDLWDHVVGDPTRMAVSPNAQGADDGEKASDDRRADAAQED